MSGFDNPAGKPVRLFPPGGPSSARLANKLAPPAVDVAELRELVATLYPDDQELRMAFLRGVTWGVNKALGRST